MTLTSFAAAFAESILFCGVWSSYCGLEVSRRRRRRGSFCFSGGEKTRLPTYVVSMSRERGSEREMAGAVSSRALGVSICDAGGVVAPRFLACACVVGRTAGCGGARVIALSQPH